MIKTHYLLAAGAAICCASPALARDGQAYIEFDGGVVFPEDFDYNQIEPATGPVQVLDTDMGFDAGVIVGYDFGAFRLEGEGSYRQAGNKTLQTPGGLIPENQLRGNASALSLMVNGLFDIGKDDGFQVFLGGGAGYANVSLDVTSNPVVIDDGGWGFAWQGLAGFRFPISDKVDLGVKYRYFNVSGVEFDTGPASVSEGDWTSHSVLATLAINLGGKAAPPPPPPPPVAPPPPPPPPPARPAPPAPPKPVCETGPFIVFFDFDRSEITAEAATILNGAVTAYGNCGMARVMLAGHTDRSGSAAYNVGLAERRNAAVRSYLTARGVSDGRITSEAFGESQPRVPTEDGVREAQNRRVEITYGPGSGM